jgi:hypothetical protein
MHKHHFAHQALLNANEPFSPFNLLAAGVPESEINWFVGLTPAGQCSVLTTTRGGLLLEQLRCSSLSSPRKAATARNVLSGAE